MENKRNGGFAFWMKKKGQDQWKFKKWWIPFWMKKGATNGNKKK